MATKLHIATSRPIGFKCAVIAEQMGYELTSMEDCEVFISVLYDKLIPEEYIKSRPCFNFHPGILPKYRGAGAFSWAIINQEEESGITLHEIDRRIDHGRIIEIDTFYTGCNDTAESLFNTAMDVLVDMFKKHLPDLMAGTYVAHPPDYEESRIYFRKDLDAAKDLTRFVRAFTFEGKENAYYFNKDGEKIYLCL